MLVCFGLSFHLGLAQCHILVQLTDSLMVVHMHFKRYKGGYSSCHQEITYMLILVALQPFSDKINEKEYK